MLNLSPSSPINNYSMVSNFTVQHFIHSWIINITVICKIFFLYKNFSYSKIWEEADLSINYIFQFLKTFLQNLH